MLYWEPQAFNWQGYTKGAWNTNGRPTIALDAFIEGTTQPPPGNSVTLQENLTGFCGVDGTIDSNHAGYTGTGFANSNNATNAGVRWRVNAAAAGNFTLQWRFANGTTRQSARKPARQWRHAVDGGAAGHGRMDHLDELGLGHRGACGPAPNDIALVATTSGGLANVDSLTVTGSGISATACN